MIVGDPSDVSLPKFLLVGRRRGMIEDRRSSVLTHVAVTQDRCRGSLEVGRGELGNAFQKVGDRPQWLLSLVHSFRILLRPLAGYLVTAASPDLRGR